MADPELERVNGIALMAMQALLGLVSSDVVAVAVAAEERVLLSFWVHRHTPEIDEDVVDVIGELEAFLYPDNPLIESRVVVGAPEAAVARPHERMIYWAKC